jgi:hypothetical protein
VAEGAEREDDIQKALFVGNYEGAVDTCFKAGRLADALLVANIGGAELFKKTMHRYMRRNPRPYMAVSAGRGWQGSGCRRVKAAGWGEGMAAFHSQVG